MDPSEPDPTPQADPTPQDRPPSDRPKYNRPRPGRSRAHPTPPERAPVPQSEVPHAEVPQSKAPQPSIPQAEVPPVTKPRTSIARTAAQPPKRPVPKIGRAAGLPRRLPPGNDFSSRPAAAKYDDDPGVKKRYRIQRLRLGKIMQMRPDGQFGFISAEDFHNEDVFFHRDHWDGKVVRNGREVFLRPEEGMWVEFEIDDDKFESEKRLRATIVRPTERPIGRKLSGRDATFDIVTHHPRARRKRPTWRDKDE